jgi:diguanylate cyclase (GGDEF)-like protein
MPHQSKQRGIDLAYRLMEKLRSTCFLAEAGINLHLQASFGVAAAPDDGVDVHALIRAADTAMYSVKNSTRNGVAAAGQVSTAART